MNYNKILSNVKEVCITFVVFFYYLFKGLILFFVPQSYLQKKVDGEIVLITGAGSGLGQGLSVKFAEAGATIVAVDLNENGLNKTRELVEKVNGKIYCYVCDISISENVYKMAKRVEQEVGFVSILINNAGIVSGKKFLSLEESKIRKTFEVNCLAIFWTCKAFLPEMRSRSYGHIVNVASLAGLNGAVQLIDYSASKFAVVGLSESLRYELFSEGFTNIKVTSICPFFINTGMFAGTESRIIPILEQDYAVNKIYSAVLSNQEILIMPRIFILIRFFQSFLPSDACNYIYGKIGGHTMMSKFIGRQKTN